MLRKKAELERGEKGELLMTTHNLRLFCLENKFYEYLDFNSKIYLHYKGFTQIANLDAYVNLISLCLENKKGLLVVCISFSFGLFFKDCAVVYKFEGCPKF